MRFALSLAAAILLSGCTTVSTVRDAWNWDATAAQAHSPIVLAPEQVAALTSRLAELQIRRNEIRSRISAEPDIRARQRLYDDLHAAGRELSPLERQLTAATAR